jgi:hypothetical protein
MKKTIFALAAAATIAAGTLAAPSPAEARCFGWGCGIGLGVLGGVVAGTALGLAIAGHPGYYVYDDYDANPPMDCPGYWGRKPIRDEDGRVVGWSRPRWFCR